MANEKFALSTMAQEQCDGSRFNYIISAVISLLKKRFKVQFNVLSDEVCLSGQPDLSRAFKVPLCVP